jgi:hypothetical protein
MRQIHWSFTISAAETIWIVGSCSPWSLAGSPQKQDIGGVLRCGWAQALR